MRDPGEQHAAVTGEPAASKRCTAGSGRGPLEKEPHSGNLASGLPVPQHGRVQGRSFRLGAGVVGDECGRMTLRVEVTDARGERLPDTRPQLCSPEAESGHGLLLVDALADRWGVTQGPVPCKTVWAEIDLP